jgi:molecular chaperone IbpA
MRTYDLSPLYRSTVGFDRLFSLLDAVNKADEGGYPPYNIERLDENNYRITLAVAGFSEDDLTIEVKENTLTVSGQRPDHDEGQEFLHRGIAGRSFERRFQLADHVVVDSARLENGLLSISLRRELPEAMKPRRIEISGAEDRDGTARPSIEAEAA